MKEALTLAEKGRGWTSPNPMVGAVVVREGNIVGRGWHRAAGKPHAEVEAIEDAGGAAWGADLYVTLEPCNHYGRTPPCTDAILAAGIRRVVTAMADPNPEVAGGGHDRLREAGIEVVTGVCGTEAMALNEIFVHYARTRRPLVIAKCAATLDGRIATRTGDSKWVTGPRSRAFVHRLRHTVDGIMVGIGTVRADDPSLTTRLEAGPGRDPRRIILDTRLSIPPEAKVLRPGSEAETLVVAGPDAPRDRADAIEGPGVRVLRAPVDRSGRIDLARLMETMGGMGITSILSEGGAQVLGAAFAAGIVHKIHFFYAPKILGGDDGIPVCAGPGPDRMAGAVAIRDITVHRFDDDVMVEGYVAAARRPADRDGGRGGAEPH